MLKLSNITKKYDKNVIFENFSIQFEHNKINTIMGKSGVGKTTLLNIIANLTDYQGEVQMDKPISYIFQAPRLIENLTVKQNLVYVMKNSGIKSEVYNATIDKMLEMAEILDKKDSLVSNLSGGQKQRVSIVRAFIYPSKVMLLDEPFNSLDISLKLRIINLFARFLQNYPKTVLLVSHDIDEAVMLSDNIFILDNGKVSHNFKFEDRKVVRDNNSQTAVDIRNKIYSILTNN